MKGRTESVVVRRRFWELIGEGLPTREAAAGVGVSKMTGERWFHDGGGMQPYMSLGEPSGRFLGFAEREEIALGLAAGHGVREIARRLGRSPSTVSREIRRHAPLQGHGARRRRNYRAGFAHAQAQIEARRPRAAKLATNRRLRAYVQAKLSGPERWSPEQIAARLRLDFPDDEDMRVSHECIYQAIYVQGRGALRRELATCLRTGRALRKPRRREGMRGARIKDMVLISERPPEVEDRAVPGHWEGDLLVGTATGSAIGTLVERSTRFTMLLHLTDQRAATVRDAITATITTLPTALCRSLTWDQGREMAEHAQLRLDTNLQVYFCDPRSPWQRGTNENTNGLLRQYFPKGTDLSVHTPADLAAVAAGLNGRPRKTLGWCTPAEALSELLSET